MTSSIFASEQVTPTLRVEIEQTGTSFEVIVVDDKRGKRTVEATGPKGYAYRRYQQKITGLKRSKRVNEELHPGKPMIGRMQRMALKSMVERNNGVWYFGCGWIIDTESGTVKIMESLVKRGFATKREIGSVYVEKGEYTITDAGREAVA